MIETLIAWDKELFLFLNGFNNGFWDVVMTWLSNKFFWIPLYALFIYWIIRDHRKDAVWIILSVVLLVVISDQVSVHGFKNVFLRLRPCHDPELEGLVHIVNGKCGGRYGFYSSHASNHFALAVFFSILFSNKFRFITPVLLGWAAIVSYSRIYLGVHFPVDVLAGAVMGILIGWGVMQLLRKFRPGILQNG